MNKLWEDALLPLAVILLRVVAAFSPDADAPLTQQAPAFAPKKPMSAFKAALSATSLSFAAGAFTVYCSNYATRSDQHAQEAGRCTGLEATLLDITYAAY